MTKQEFEKNKETILANEKAVRAKMEELNFPESWGGPGDYSETWIAIDGKAYHFTLHNMEEDYWGDFPDGTVHFRGKERDMWVESVDQLMEILSDGENYSWEIKFPGKEK